jgi:hypothetical protein
LQSRLDIFKFVKWMRSTIRAQKIIVIALLSILIQLNSFVTKKRFLAPPTQKSWLRHWASLKAMHLILSMNLCSSESFIRFAINSFNYYLNSNLCQYSIDLFIFRIKYINKMTRESNFLKRPILMYFYAYNPNMKSVFS